MKELEPELKEIKNKFKDNKEEIAKKTMELYKAHGVSPFSGCLVMIFQLPIMIALYHVFWKGLDINGDILYSFVSRPAFTDMNFLGIDLAVGSAVLAVLTGLTQFLQMRLAYPPSADKKDKKGKKSSSKPGSFQEDFSRMMKMQMTYVFPFFIGWIALRFPAAVALYWTTMNVFAIVHEGIVRVRAKKIQNKKTNERSNTPQNQRSS